VRDNKLIMDFHGDTHAPNSRHVEFSLAMFDDDHFAICRSSGAVTTLERQK
jgi:hypothetical protein